MNRFRRVDWGLVLTVLTLVGIIWQAHAKSEPWDKAVTDIAEIRPMVYNHDKQLAVFLEKLSSINEHLASIDKKMGR